MSVPHLILTVIVLMSISVAARPAEQEIPMLTQIDHFFIQSAESERLFRLFRDDFQLPEAWPYQRYGGFASGGLTLGNAAIEFVTMPTPDGAPPATEFKGIAFEPAGDAAAAVAAMDRRGIPHAEPVPFKYTAGGQEHVIWINVFFAELPPENVFVFVCDYVARAKVAAERAAAAAELARRDGGPLGVVAVEEIVLGVESFAAASAPWARLIPGPQDPNELVFTFAAGPRLRVIEAAVPGVQHILIRVKSAARAERFLAGKGMLAEKAADWLRIAPAAVGGLDIRLTGD